VDIEREVKYFSRANHANIVQLFGTTRDPEDQIIIAMEYAECGSLYDYLHKTLRDNPETEVSVLRKLSWMLQCAKVLMNFLILYKIISIICI